MQRAELHFHLLPGVDDGPGDMAESVELARLAVADGTSLVTVTPHVRDLLRRGIACGGFADPWNVLGFQGLFPLSASREDSIRDPRLDELMQVVEQTFNLYSRLISEASATSQPASRCTGGSPLCTSERCPQSSSTPARRSRHHSSDAPGTSRK